MKFYRVLASLAIPSASLQAQAAVSCSVSATNVSGIYTSFLSTLSVTGTISVNCTRTSGDAASQTLYIGIDNGGNSRRMTHQTSTATMTYDVFRLSSYAGTWNTDVGITSTTSTSAGGLQFTLNFGSAMSASVNQNYYLRVPWLQIKSAGIYDDTSIGVIVRSGSYTGTVLDSTTFTASTRILSSCRISSNPNALAMTYSSFAASPQTGSTSFGVSCNLSTPYTLSLSNPSGNLLGLNYALALSATSSVGTGFESFFNVNGSIASGQAGSCGSATCLASQAHTITITY